MGMGKRKLAHPHPHPHPSTAREQKVQYLLSGLPPTNFSIQPHHLLRKRRLWPKINVGNTPAVTKSWLPIATRCGGAHQLPQLRRVTSGPPENPTHNHFLANPTSILETALERGEVTYWCLLEYSDTKEKAEIRPPQQSDHLLRRELQLSCVRLVGSEGPCPGITVSYSVVMDADALRILSWPRYSMYRQAVTVRYECAVSDPFDAKRKPMEFMAMIRLGRKYYAVSLQGAVAAMEVLGTRLRITTVGPTRAVPTSRSRLFKQDMAEMKEEILLVYLIHHEFVQVVDDVEIFRLDLNKLDLIKVEKLPGKTMFLKESRWEWVESAEFGCRDNCVFFTEGKENKWRVYDLKTRCISSVLSEN